MSHPRRPDLVALKIIVQGTVQGVGFRPFVHRLAISENLNGRVHNSASGVHIEIFGPDANIARFRQRLHAEKPPLARIDQVSVSPLSARAPNGFTITSSTSGEARTAVTPDASMCTDCRREVFDPSDRRHGYPFLNCTHCGPRFSIVSGLPYDRFNTSMRDFIMCPACEAEYRDIDNRRFHAQPTACAECGPGVWYETTGTNTVQVRSTKAIDAARTLLNDGGILAVKGIGGFHLACNALNREAIAQLRRRKHRPGKPFAVMFQDLAVAGDYCELCQGERDLLNSVAAPIVLAEIRQPATLPDNLAPGLGRLGVMLPYSPLHALLSASLDYPLVMTSANAGSNPQVTENDLARRQLAAFADGFLMHDRQIVNRVDDSLVQYADGGPQILRRARGYAPEPVSLPPGFGDDHPQVLALGGDMKNAFAIAKGGNIVLSQHIGDLDNLRTFTDLVSTIGIYRELYDLHPDLIAADAHDAYRSRQYAGELAHSGNLPLVEVRHHHAHAAACMVENGLELDHPPVLALVQDGIGLGEGGALWGAELLLCDYRSASRLATLRPAELAGGDKAARQPWRNLVARLSAAYDAPQYWPAPFQDRLTGYRVDTLLAAMGAKLNAPLCSSAGRLFDAVAAAAGLCCAQQDYEGEAAMRLQSAAEHWLKEHERPPAYRMKITLASTGLTVVDPGPIWADIAVDLERRAPPGRIAARFHITWAEVWCQVIQAIAADRNPAPAIVLSGGVFQNRLFTSLMQSTLNSFGFSIMTHRQIPANDGGLALGQAALAIAGWKAGLKTEGE